MNEDTEVERIDPEEMFKSLNGFEEIAIEKVFTCSAAELALKADGGNTFPLMRALLFVEAKRSGAKDGESYRSVMNLRMDDVVSRFSGQEGEDEQDAGVDEGKAPGPTATGPTQPS
jgi:hypothetical protein